MRTREQLLAIMEGVCGEIRRAAPGNAEVPERLVVVAGGAVSVVHEGGLDAYGDGGVIAFVNDSGVPFVEQGDHLIERAAGMGPEAVLLGGTALVGRPGGPFRRVLAVQLFSRAHGMRLARVAVVSPEAGTIESIGPWREADAGPQAWVEEILSRAAQ